MTRTGAREREDRSNRRAAIGRVLLAGLVAVGTTAMVNARAEAQTAPPAATTRPLTTVPSTMPHETVIEMQDTYGSGAGPAMMGTGFLILTAGWVSSFAVGLHEGPELFVTDAQLNQPRRWFEDFRFTSFIPVAGPWIALSQIPQGTFGDDWWGVWLVANGLVQATGFTLFLMGLIAHYAHEGRVSRRQSIHVTDAGPQIQVLPSVGVNQAALTVSGTF